MMECFLNEHEIKILFYSYLCSMATAPVETEKLLESSKAREVSDNHGSDEENASLNDSFSTYAHYHRVCDMRKVFDASPIGIAAIIVTFMLVFNSWCAWHEVIEWVGVQFNMEGQRLVQFAAIVNGIAVVVLALLLLALRYFVGPVLSYYWRSFFAVLLVFTAIAVWEALEACVDMLIGTDSGERATFYLISCAVPLVLVLIFEKFLHYDVIGNHLLVPP